MKLPVYNHGGNKTKRSVEFDDAVFGIEPNDHVIWLDVRAIQAHGRQGTHKTKERSEISRSTRKLYRQKGTGHARVGDAKSPIRRGGGTVFGPKPHEYRLGVNRKTRKLARRSALAHKFASENVRVIEDIALKTPKTKEMVSILQANDIASQKVLVLTASADNNLYLSGRNIPKVTVCPAAEASTLALMNAQTVLILESAVDVLTDALIHKPKASHADAA
ncbi:MAG: 50S ribosomal protein L4 [Rubricoccaceae bacterium]|nr:50S ribosomal protein L4 [Rubricoccaceae bacterium]